ncbi:MAG: transposase, partial [Candidatus Accumulibacter phosphatis]|nr:transposase [Candidatus Accumulibacter phosphatis]
DHVHWLLELASEVSVSDAVRIYRAKVSLSLGRRIWQKGFHDRAVRRDEDLAAVARYVVHNPVRAGLVERLGDYPHWDAVWI